MPRETIPDHTTDTRKVEVTWRRDENEPGYVQLATKDSRSVAMDLVGAAIGIISNVDAPHAGWPNQDDGWRQAAQTWLTRAAQADLDGVFVHLGPDECQRLTNRLHKAKRQAFGGECGQVPCDHAPDGGNHPLATPGNPYGTRLVDL